MGLVWVACAVLLDMNASYGPCHPTISRCWLLHYIEYVEQISWSPCSALLYLSSQPASRRAEPIVCLLICGPTCQWKRKRTHWTCTSFTLTCWWWKTNPIKIFGGRFLSYSRVVRFYLQFNPRCTSRGFNYHSIFLHDTTWMLDVPRVGKRRKNLTKSSVVLSD